MIGQTFLSEQQRDLLITAYQSVGPGPGPLQFIGTMPGLRSALEGLVRSEMLAFAGEDLYLLTPKGRATASVLLTNVTA